MSFPTRRSARRTTTGATALLCLAALVGQAAASATARPAYAQTSGGLGASRPAGPAVTPADIAALDAAVDAAERAAVAAAEDLFQAAGNAAGVRIAIDESSLRADEARAALSLRVRELYKTGRPDPMTRLLAGLGDGNGLNSVATAGVRSDQSMIADVDRESRELDKLRRSAAAQEVALAAKVKQVAALQEQAIRLLTDAQVRYADDQVKLAALEERKRQLAAQAAAAREAAAQEAAAAQQLAAQQAAAAAAASGPAVSLTGVTPTVTARGQKAAAAEAPVIAALEAAGSGMPPGYRATGRTIVGKASWYGPGFYGKPTATGAPYDAERHTCAMLAVPLGTVVRVTTDEGRAINVLVNDRGPYVGNRVIDMSAIGARTLGYSGVRQVTIEVLEPIG